MEIECLKHLPDGSFATLPVERQTQLLAWYRKRMDPDGKGKSKAKKPAGRGRDAPGKRPPKRSR